MPRFIGCAPINDKVYFRFSPRQHDGKKEIYQWHLTSAFICYFHINWLINQICVIDQRSSSSHSQLKHSVLDIGWSLTRSASRCLANTIGWPSPSLSVKIHLLCARWNVLVLLSEVCSSPSRMSNLDNLSGTRTNFVTISVSQSSWRVSRTSDAGCWRYTILYGPSIRYAEKITGDSENQVVLLRQFYRSETPNGEQQLDP